MKDGIDPDETNGHIDDVACFVRPGEVACIWTDDQNNPFYDWCQAAYETLSNATDAKGRKLKVHKLTMPKEPTYMTKEEVETIDVVEGTLARTTEDVAIASYMNFLIVNGGVIVPQYDDEYDALALKQIGEMFPDRKVVRRAHPRSGLRRRQHPLHHPAAAERQVAQRRQHTCAAGGRDDSSAARPFYERRTTRERSERKPGRPRVFRGMADTGGRRACPAGRSGGWQVRGPPAPVGRPASPPARPRPAACRSGRLAAETFFEDLPRCPLTLPAAGGCRMRCGRR